MSEPIDDLRQRWEEDPTPQLSVQLAEEYRRLDRRQDAVEVLSRALEENPEHVAARVALGRFRFELGELDEARRLLEQVVTEDPTNLVASKLLVHLYLDRGEERQAQDRLDLYKLLNAGDPDIELLEARLRGEAEPIPMATPATMDIPSNGDPFGGLWEGIGDAAYWQALGAEGIFPVAATTARAWQVAKPVAPPGPPAEEPAAATVTLANLYLEQGHLRDARQAFDEVLAREPGNRQALAALEEIGRRQAAEAAGLEAPAVATDMGGADVTSRKVAVLREFLARIRAADRG